ncbi:hypothetical protein I4U23_005397 [Adineta vaga]|nr:hypothetical protein I4U23_005397 [Adineta vaga]
MSSISYSNISVQFGIYVGLPIVIFGIIGNLINICLLYSTRSIPSSYLLFLSSFFNIIALFEALLPRILSLSFNIDSFTTNIIWCKSRFFISFTVTLISLTCICFASIDRYFVTCRNVIWRNRSKLSTAKLFIFIASVVITGINIPILYFTTIIESISINGTITRRCLIINSDFLLYQNYFLRPILPGILPALILGITGFLTYRNISSINGNNHLRDVFQRSLTSMILLQIILIVVPLAPFATIIIYQLLTVSVMKSSQRLEQETMISNIFNILLYISYASNFYVYLISAPYYRRKFIQFIPYYYYKNQRNNHIGIILREQPEIHRISML